MNANMHKEMFHKYIIRPLIDAFSGLFEYLLYKVLILLSSLPGMLALDLFTTPERWWKGLVWVVIADWIGGMITAIRRGEFDINVAAQKWYQVAGYILVCGSAAVVANSLQEIPTLYYMQFIVYAMFFAKEFHSILKTWKVLSLFIILWKMASERNFTVEGFEEFREEINRQSNKAHEKH